MAFEDVAAVLPTVVELAAGVADEPVDGVNADKRLLTIVTGETGEMALTMLDKVDTPANLVCEALIDCNEELIACTLMRILPMLAMDMSDDAPRLLSATCIPVVIPRSPEMISAIFIEIAEKLTGRPIRALEAMEGLLSSQRTRSFRMKQSCRTALEAAH